MTTNKLYRSVSLNPFKYLKHSIRTESYWILCLLIPQVLMLFLTKSYNSLIVLTAVLTASLLNEIIRGFFSVPVFSKNNTFTFSEAIIKGLMIGLLLPSDFPPVAAFLITFGTILLDKCIFGEKTNSWINPVAITVATCWLVGMKFFPTFNATLSDLQGRNPALTLIQNGIFPTNSFDIKITSFLNKRIFSFFGVSIPDGYVSLMWDSHSSIPAFRFNFLTIVSSIIMFSFDVVHPLIPVVYLCVYSILIKFIAPFIYSGPLFQGDILLALLTSGTLFCTMFILQWHGTIPFTNRGKFLYGLFSGIIAFLIVGVGLSPAGTIFTILAINIISLLIQSAENNITKKLIKNVLIPKAKSIAEGNHA